MAGKQLSIVHGDLAQTRRRRQASGPEELARRWRAGGQESGASPPPTGDVIPLLDGWIRRLERQAGLDQAANET